MLFKNQCGEYIVVYQSHLLNIVVSFFSVVIRCSRGLCRETERQMGGGGLFRGDKRLIRNDS